jgi:hypothetical protein
MTLPADKRPPWTYRLMCWLFGHVRVRQPLYRKLPEFGWCEYLGDRCPRCARMHDEKKVRKRQRTSA